jgi:hypothetical protein
VWTDGRVAEWQATGIRPAVAVWTSGHLAVFLDTVTADQLFALWWLIALRGLRRGETCGLRWTGTPSPCSGSTSAANSPTAPDA